MWVLTPPQLSTGQDRLCLPSLEGCWDLSLEQGTKDCCHVPCMAPGEQGRKGQLCPCAGCPWGRGWSWRADPAPRFNPALLCRSRLPPQSRHRRPPPPSIVLDVTC